MSQKITFPAEPRTILGKKVKQLRKQSKMAANISGDVEKTVPISIDQVGFNKLYHQVGDTGLFYLKVEGESKDRPVLISEVQRDPLSAQAFHVTFRQVDLSEKVKAEVPVVLTGELQVKNALVVTVHDAIEVEALPQDLPEKFVVDISKFTEFGQSVLFSDLEYDHEKVTLSGIAEEELTTPVVMVQEIKEVVEPVEAAPAPVEGAPAEGAAGAEGAAAPADAAKADEKKE